MPDKHKLIVNEDNGCFSLELDWLYIGRDAGGANIFFHYGGKCYEASEFGELLQRETTTTGEAKGGRKGNLQGSAMSKEALLRSWRLLAAAYGEERAKRKEAEQKVKRLERDKHNVWNASFD